MAAGTGAAPGQAPPDLPSLLLDGRICYIGMPVSILNTLLHAPAHHYDQLIVQILCPSSWGCSAVVFWFCKPQRTAMLPFSVFVRKEE